LIFRPKGPLTAKFAKEGRKVRQEIQIEHYLCNTRRSGNAWLESH
jgi:hypothetical protein